MWRAIVVTVSFVGVILAAGKGTRMKPFSSRWPKPVLPVLGEALARHQVAMMRAVGVTRVFVVVGHLGREVERALGDGADLGVSITYVEQRETLGIAHALGHLERRLAEPFLLFLGDIYFVSSRLGAMLERYERGDVRGVLASKIEARPEMIQRNFAIVADHDARVTRVIEKPCIAPSTRKGCGLYLFGPEMFGAIRRTPRSAMRDEYELTDAIQIMIDDGHRVVYADVIDDDLNLTVPDDLLDLNLRELDRRGLAQLGAPEGSSVTRSVLGPHVHLGAGTSLHECVVFEGVDVPPGQHLTRAIVTPDGVVQCATLREAT